jgi:hypothetical protein
VPKSRAHRGLVEIVQYVRPCAKFAQRPTAFNAQRDRSAVRFPVAGKIGAGGAARRRPQNGTETVFPFRFGSPRRAAQPLPVASVGADSCV